MPTDFSFRLSVRHFLTCGRKYTHAFLFRSSACADCLICSRTLNKLQVDCFVLLRGSTRAVDRIDFASAKVCLSARVLPFFREEGRRRRQA